MPLKSNRPWLSCCCLLLAEFSSSFTITTFNILAPVHRSMHGHYNRRESEDERWWRPRAEAVAKYISENLVRTSVPNAKRTNLPVLYYNTYTLFRRNVLFKNSLHPISYCYRNGGSTISLQIYLTPIYKINFIELPKEDRVQKKTACTSTYNKIMMMTLLETMGCAASSVNTAS